MLKRSCRKSGLLRLLWNLPLIIWTSPLSLAKVAIMLLHLQAFALASPGRTMCQATGIFPTGCGSLPEFRAPVFQQLENFLTPDSEKPLKHIWHEWPTNCSGRFVGDDEAGWECFSETHFQCQSRFLTGCEQDLIFSPSLALILSEILKIMWKAFLWKSQPLHQYDFKLRTWSLP